MCSFLTSEIAPPRSEAVLLERADRLAGRSLGSIARSLGQQQPRRLQHDKGGPGRLIECALGADANSRPLPDFTAIGVELKTIPLSPDGRPQESTYVCMAAMDGSDNFEFDRSHLWRKLRRVLWVPIIKVGDAPEVAKRIVGAAFLWSPDRDQYNTLRADWEELNERIARGQGEITTAHYGAVLQLRPKATHATERVAGITSDGDRGAVRPRAFYLRTAFTASVLCAAYVFS